MDFAISMHGFCGGLCTVCALGVKDFFSQKNAWILRWKYMDFEASAYEISDLGNEYRGRKRKRKSHMQSGVDSNTESCAV